MPYFETLSLDGLSLDGITAVAFLLLSGGIFILGVMFRRLQSDPIRERLRSSKTAGVSANGALIDSLAAQLPYLTSQIDALDEDLRRAGYYKPTARNEYLALRNGLMILTGLTAASIAVALGPEQDELGLRVLLCGLLLVSCSWALPRVLLNLRGKRRVQRIRAALPDALDMISMSLTGGLALQDALAHVSRELYFAHPDLAMELLIVRKQADLISFDLAFEQFSQRIDSDEVSALSALVLQSRRLGTDIAKAICDYADSMRLMRRQGADERASKAGVKLLFPLTLCLLPAVFILLWGPAVLELVDFLQQIEDTDITASSTRL